MPLSPEDAYNNAAERAAEIAQRGQVNPLEAWHEVDPDGTLRKQEALRLQRIQDEINHLGAQATRKVAEPHEVVEAKAIPDPVAREKELTYLRAKEIAKQQINSRGY